MGGLDESGRGRLDVIGAMVDPVETLHHALMQHRQPRGPVEVGTLLAMHIEWGEDNHPHKRQCPAFVPIGPRDNDASAIA